MNTLLKQNWKSININFKYLTIHLSSFFPCLHYMYVYFEVQMEKQKVFLNTNYMYMEIWYLYVAINNKQKLQIVVHISCLKAGRPVYENNTSKHIVDKNRQKYSYIPLPWSLHSSKTKTFTEGHYLWTVQRNKRISYINTLNIDMLLECVIFFFFPRFTNIYLDMKQPLYM